MKARQTRLFSQLLHSGEAYRHHRATLCPSFNVYITLKVNENVFVCNANTAVFRSRGLVGTNNLYYRSISIYSCKLYKNLVDQVRLPSALALSTKLFVPLSCRWLMKSFEKVDFLFNLFQFLTIQFIVTAIFLWLWI